MEACVLQTSQAPLELLTETSSRVQAALFLRMTAARAPFFLAVHVLLCVECMFLLLCLALFILQARVVK